MAEIILVTGGARSGKSAGALRLAGRSGQRVFIATAEALDEEMIQRIARHQAERSEDWETVERHWTWPVRSRGSALRIPPLSSTA